jgi:23S rRNA (pseudouridine1915-N3)-methyltransferase
VRLTIAAVGRLRAGPEKALVDAYLGRLAWPVSVREVAKMRAREPVVRRERENRLLLAALPAGARLVALDSRGLALDSEGFAARLGDWQDRGVAELGFLVGGADGLEAATLARAELVLSFGRMTWPHLLARAMLAEQLYRAQSILAGHPYHRGAG